MKHGIRTFRRWLIEIQQSDWLVTVVQNSTDNAVQNHVLKTIHDGLNHSPLSFRHLKMF